MMFHKCPCVYLLECLPGGVFKLGQTWDLRRRVVENATRYGAVRLIGYIVTNDPLETERYIQRNWRQWRVDTRELYRLPPDAVRQVTTVRVVNWYGKEPESAEAYELLCDGPEVLPFAPRGKYIRYPVRIGAIVYRQDPVLADA
jgi:hypothetical protein